MAIEALIFDLDGVLANTIDLHFRSWQFLAAQYGRTFTQANLERWRGQRRRDCLIDFFALDNLDEAEIDRRLEIKNRYYLQLLHQTDAVDLLAPATLSLLENARRYGLKTGVASSSLNAYEVIRHLKLEPLLDIIADGNTVSRPKPHPDIFLWTAGALLTAPANAIVFEDSAAGVTAAQTVDMFVVGVGSKPYLQQANLVIPELRMMTLDGLLRAVREYRASQFVTAN